MRRLLIRADVRISTERSDVVTILLSTPELKLRSSLVVCDSAASLSPYVSIILNAALSVETRKMLQASCSNARSCLQWHLGTLNSAVESGRLTPMTRGFCSSVACTRHAVRLDESVPVL